MVNFVFFGFFLLQVSSSNFEIFWLNLKQGRQATSSAGGGEGGERKGEKVGHKGRNSGFVERLRYNYHFMQEVEVRVWEVSKYFEFVMPNQLNVCECQKNLSSKIFTAKKTLF